MQTPLSEKDYIQQLSIDCVIIGYHNRTLQVLAPKLRFKGDFWALPSGFVFQQEDIDEAAGRILFERTGIRGVSLRQFNVTGKASRNSRAFMDRLIEQNPELVSWRHGEKQINDHRDYQWFTKRFITICYYALVDIEKVTPQKTDLDESIEWYPINALPEMIMDHTEIVAKALEMLQLEADQKGNAFHLLPETFTMKDAQELYETLFDKPFARNNFQKKLLAMNVLERVEKKFTGAANKAPYLYRLPAE